MISVKASRFPVVRKVVTGHWQEEKFHRAVLSVLGLYFAMKPGWGEEKRRRFRARGKNRPARRGR